MHLEIRLKMQGINKKILTHRVQKQNEFNFKYIVRYENNSSINTSNIKEIIERKNTLCSFVIAN